MAEAQKKPKDKRIRSEKTRLRKLYKPLDPQRYQIALGLIDNAAMMRVELEDLAEDLAENGWYEKFSQGNQEPYDRARPAGQTYNSMVRNYQQIMGQLEKMLPKEEAKEAEKDDGFWGFARERDVG